MLLRDPHDARPQAPVEPRCQAPRGAVRADRHRLARPRCRARVASACRDLHLRRGALELELRHALDGGPAEERRGSGRAGARPSLVARARSGASTGVRPGSCAGSGAGPRAGLPGHGSTRCRSGRRGRRRRRARRRPAARRPGAGAAAGPRGSRTCRRARGSSCPGRRHATRASASLSNIVVVRTKRARSASSSTRGSEAISSPETMSAPISPSGGSARARPRPRLRRARSGCPAGSRRSLLARARLRARRCARRPSDRPPTRRAPRARPA